MKRTLFFLLVLVLLSSCKTSKKVLYFQDVYNEQAFPAQLVKYIKVMPGDKLSIIISSLATPELASRYNISNSSLGQTYSNNNTSSTYTVDENGEIDIPSLGRVKIGGLTRAEISTKIQDILHAGIINDAIVTVNTFNQYITVLGEAGHVGRIPIDRDNLTIIEAIGKAGDLTIDGLRNKIVVMRQEGGKVIPYYVDIRSKDIFNSPVYNLQQNDIIYIEPNKKKIGSSTINDNSFRSYGTWIGLISFAMSLSVMIWK